MVIAAGRDEGRLLAIARHDLEAEDAAVEAERALEVGHFEVDVADVDTRIDRADVHAAIVQPRSVHELRFEPVEE